MNNLSKRISDNLARYVSPIECKYCSHQTSHHMDSVRLLREAQTLIESLKAENKKLRGALEKYARKIEGTAGLEIISESGEGEYIESFGSLARFTLKKLDEEK